MKLRIYFAITLILAAIWENDIKAAYVVPNTAGKLAENFFGEVSGLSEAEITAQLVRTYNSENGVPLLYLFNIDSVGFVIVSADNRVKPVLAYSTQTILTDNHSPGFHSWVREYCQQLEVAKLELEDVPTPEWEKYLKKEFDDFRGGTAVAPLVQTQWGQSVNYNAMCPYDSVGGGKSLVGCGAVALAQIMKYWNYPSTGKWSHRYQSWGIGEQYANFGAATYNWSNMPNSVVGANNDVAQLMYHVGVAVEMQYGATSSSSSMVLTVYPSAFTSLKNFFAYDASTVQLIDRNNFTTPQWISKIKAELDAGRPVEYEGPGHLWVCDGYDANNNLHMNWGWLGSDDGYYSVDALVNGGGNFNQNQKAMIGIKPQPATSKPRSVFRSSSNIICAGGSIQYSDSSFGGTPTSWQWYFPGGTPSSSTQQNPLVTYVSGGKFQVTLIATNAYGSDTMVRNNYANVVPVVNLPLNETFESSAGSFPPAGWTVYGELNSLSSLVPTWKSGLFSSGYGQGFVSATKDFFSDFVAGPIDILSTPILNMTNTNGVRIRYDYAYAMRDTVRADSVSIFYTDGCGGDMHIVKTMGGRSFVTAPDTTGSFKPKATQWKTDSVDILIPPTVNQIRLGFITKTGRGNNLYIDNINVSGANVVSAIEDVNVENESNVYPNPVGDVLNVITSNNPMKKFQLLNSTGQIILSGVLEGQYGAIDFQSIPKGVYNLRLQTLTGVVVHKIVK